MTRRSIDGSLNRERLRGLRSSGPKRRVASLKRPAIEERRRRVQAWLLERYTELGVFEHVLDHDAFEFHLAGCEAVKHERIVRIRTVTNPKNFILGTHLSPV